MSTFAKVIGVVFVLVAVLGFIPNPIVGDGKIFQTNLAHNLVHLVLGVLLFATATSNDSAALWLKIVGAVYLLVAILGFVKGGGLLLGIVDINAADNWLHVVLGVVLLAAGFMGNKDSAPMMPQA